MEDRIKKLEQEVEFLKQRRVSQSDIIPQAVKLRHLGEGVPYIQSGLAANRPTSGAVVTSGYTIWWSYDTHVLSVWDGSQWRTVTLS